MTNKAETQPSEIGADLPAAASPAATVAVDLSQPPISAAAASPRIATEPRAVSEQITDEAPDVSTQIVRRPDPKVKGDKSTVVHYTLVTADDAFPDQGAAEESASAARSLKKRITATRIVPDLPLPVGPSTDKRLGIPYLDGRALVPDGIDLDDHNVLAAILRRAGGVPLTPADLQGLMTIELRARHWLSEIASHAPGYARKRHDDALAAFKADPDSVEKREAWEKTRDLAAAKKDDNVASSHLRQAFSQWARSEMLPLIKEVITAAIAIAEGEVESYAKGDEDLEQAVLSSPGFRSLLLDENKAARRTTRQDGGVLKAMRSALTVLRCQLQDLDISAGLPGAPSSYLRGIVHFNELAEVAADAREVASGQ
jgi:hypothetical protein